MHQSILFTLLTKRLSGPLLLNILFAFDEAVGIITTLKAKNFFHSYKCMFGDNELTHSCAPTDMFFFDFADNF